MGEAASPVVVIEQIRMKKSINLLHSVSILCAVTGHISVFVAPTAILRYTGSVGLSLVLWVLGGLMNLCIALCFTELATMFPKAGGPYAYVRQVFGEFLGFMTLWGYLLLITGPFWAVMGYTAASYITKPFYPDCKPPVAAVKVLAAWLIVTFVVVNCVYVKLVTKIQTILTTTKVLSLLLIIVCGVFKFAQGDAAPGMDDVWEGTSQSLPVVAMGFLFSVFTYGGWQIITNLMEEAKDPGRDLPRAIYVSLFIITVEFSLVNWAYFVVLSPKEILDSETVAILFFQKLYPPLKSVISVLVAITAIGVLNASVLGHSRVLFAGARNEQAPVVFCMINTKFYTPWPAVILLCLWSFVVLFSGGLFMMIELISLFSIMLSFGVVSALLYLRWTSPHTHRPYKAYLLVPLSQFVLLIVIGVLSVYQEPYKLGRGLVILAAGIPVYLVGIHWRNKPLAFRRAVDNFTVTAQKLLLVRKSA